MYAAKGGQVSTAQCAGIPAAFCKRDAVGEDTGNCAAGLELLPRGGGAACESRPCSASSAFCHADKPAAIIDSVAVDRNSLLVMSFYERFCACECKLFSARKDYAKPAIPPDELHSEQNRRNAGCVVQRAARMIRHEAKGKRNSGENREEAQKRDLHGGEIIREWCSDWRPKRKLRHHGDHEQKEKPAEDKE